jgi:hypothetical protein
VSATFRNKAAARKKRFFQDGRRRIKKRLDNSPVPDRPVPMMTATNIHYEYADRVRGLSAGGIGAIFLMAQRLELIKEIDCGAMTRSTSTPWEPNEFLTRPRPGTSAVVSRSPMSSA